MDKKVTWMMFGGHQILRQSGESRWVVLRDKVIMSEQNTNLEMYGFRKFSFLIYFAYLFYQKTLYPYLNELATMSYDQGFSKMIWISLCHDLQIGDHNHNKP